MKNETCNRCWKRFDENGAGELVYLDGDPYCQPCYQDILKEKAQYIERHQDNQPEPDYDIPSPREPGVVYWDEIGFDEWE